MTSEKPWKPRKSSYLEGLEYMKGRMNGTIRSFRTPWPSFDKIGVGDGWDWQSTIILAGRSGNLKSTIKDSIIQQSFDLNPLEKLRVLNCSFEMIGSVTALREFSSVINKPYQYLCNAEWDFKKEDLVACYNYAKIKANSDTHPVDVLEDRMTVREWEAAVEDYMESHKVGDEYTKTIISVDHSLLFVLDKGEGDETGMIRNLGNALTDLKRKYPIIFIVLSQLNRNAEQSERLEDNKAGNYIRKSDMFGSSFLEFHADIIIGVSRPATLNIRFYGSSGYIILDDRDLIIHWLKVRNGSPGISFFRCDFDSMTIRESEPLPMRNNTFKKMTAPLPVEVKRVETPQKEEKTLFAPNESFLQQGQTGDEPF